MGVLRKLGRQGDIETRWEVGHDGSIQEAQQIFDLALKDRYLAFADGEQVRKFTPDANEIILTKQLVGG